MANTSQFSSQAQSWLSNGKSTSTTSTTPATPSSNMSGFSQQANGWLMQKPQAPPIVQPKPVTTVQPQPLSPLANIENTIVQGIKKIPLLATPDNTLQSPVPNKQLLPQAKSAIQTRNIEQGVRNFAGGFVNAFPQAVKSAAQLGTDIGQGTTTPQNIAGNMADIVTAPLMFLGGGEVKPLVQGVGTAAKQGIKAATIATGKTLVKGSVVGGGFGLLGGLSSGKEITTTKDYINNLWQNIKLGVEIGGGIGTALHVVLPLAKGASAKAGAIFVKDPAGTAEIKQINMSPQVAQSTVLANDLEKTPVGKELVKQSLQADQTNSHVALIPAKNGEYTLPSGQKVDVATVPEYQPKPPVDTKTTPFDTPEIVKARGEQAKIPSTHLINTPERDALRTAISDHLYKNGGYADPAKRPTTEIRSEKRADIVIGPPASGKSTTVVDPLVKEHGAILIDNDEGKKMIPEGQGGKYAGAIHHESTDIVNGHVLEKAATNDNNIVVSAVGNNPDRLRQYEQKLHSLGYEVHLHLSEVSPETAAKRAISRFGKSGRFVDPAYVYHEVGLNPSKNYATMKTEGNYDSYTKYNNEGTASKHIEHIRKADLSGRADRSSITENASESNRSEKTTQRFDKNGNEIISLKGKQTGEPTNQQPVGSGKLRESAAFKRLVKHLETKDPEALAKLSPSELKYHQANIQDQAEKAIQLIEKDPNKAYQVAKGYENPPEGMLQHPVTMALADRALQEKNYKLWGELETSGSLHLTRSGQESAMEKGRYSDTSPHAFMRQLLNTRLTRLGGTAITEGIIRTKGRIVKEALGAKERAVAKIDRVAEQLQKEMKRQQMKIQSAQSLLDQLTCK